MGHPVDKLLLRTIKTQDLVNERQIEIFMFSVINPRIEEILRREMVLKILIYNQRWNLKNLSRGLNPPKPGLN